jgi:site-specific recombinase XerD
MLRKQGDSLRTPSQGDGTSKISISNLEEYLGDWLMDARIKGHTIQSTKSREARIGKFFWFLRYRGFLEVGTPQLKEFFLYLQTAHDTPEGRWNNPKSLPMRPIMVGNYHRIVKAFFNFLIEEELIDFDPMRRVKVVKEKTEIKPPISKVDFKKLLHSASKSEQPKRESAILWTLWDSGVRSSELCCLKREDFDESNLSIRVLGKGNKFRTVYIDPITARAIRTYLRKSPTRRDCDPLFLGRGRKPLTPNGLYLIVKRLSAQAGITCPGVHAFRRSFAVGMLRNGANAFSVQVLMGHSDLTMTRRYCKVAEADVAETHRRCSPASNL